MALIDDMPVGGSAVLPVAFTMAEYREVEIAARRHNLGVGALARRAVVLFLRAEGVPLRLPDEIGRRRHAEESDHDR